VTGIYGQDYDNGQPVGPTPLLKGLRNGRWLHKQEFAPLRYHVPGIIPEGLTVLAGAPKVGKSWIVLGLLLAAASGGTALGAIKIGQPGDVLYVALEDGDRRMQARCRVLLGSSDDPIPEQFEYMTVITPGQLTATLADWLQLHPKGFVVVDTLGRIMPPAAQGQTSYERDYQVMARLKDVADAFPGAALLMNHHDRKAISADFVDSVSGTNGIAGGADTVLVLTRPREEQAGLLQVTGRDVSEDAYALTFERGVWSLDGHDLDDAAAAAAARRSIAGLGDRSGDVVAFVSQHADGVRQGDVGAALGIDPDTAGKYLRRLAASGRVAKPSRGLYTPVSSVRSVRSANDATDGTDTTDTPLWPEP
jgi:AAA domain/Transcriptional regulator, AbiEi antitoxin